MKKKKKVINLKTCWVTLQPVTEKQQQMEATNCTNTSPQTLHKSAHLLIGPYGEFCTGHTISISNYIIMSLSWKFLFNIRLFIVRMSWCPLQSLIKLLISILPVFSLTFKLLWMWGRSCTLIHYWKKGDLSWCFHRKPVCPFHLAVYETEKELNSLFCDFCHVFSSHLSFAQKPTKIPLLWKWMNKAPLLYNRC